MRKRFLAVLFSVAGMAAPSFAQSSIRDIIQRALPPFERSAAEFVSKRTCFSCHHNTLPILALRMARDRGLKIDETALAAVESRTFDELLAPDALDRTVQATGLSDPTPNDSYLLMAAGAAGLERSLTLAVRAQQILRWQQDGHWITSDFRPPHSSSVFTATATAVRAISLYAPPELRRETDRALASARQWLVRAKPVSTEDAAFRVMGLAWANAPAKDLALAESDLRSRQAADGGWPQLPGYESDAYSTGESLFALSESGLALREDGSWLAGASFLIRTQAADGTWHVRTRMISPATVSPPYFSTGFPYGKDEFLSYAGSAWAVMALLRSRSFQEPAGLTPRDTASGEAWVRTALFGEVRQLSTLLDGGLSPNAKTANGTTLLMMAATKADKVRLLLHRGADPRVRAPSQVDALTIAAAYRGTESALRALLDAGAEAEPPDDVRVRRSPLGFASMTGDLANVKLLLDHGADPSTDTPIAEAITFGHPEVVRVLIRAGAATDIKEGSGVTLLHWATIANRAAVIPLLAKAGVPLNDADKAGFTPLMYAATIDFGETETLRALLKAGADGAIQNPDGRNAIAQAQHFKHTAIEADLRRH